MPKGFGCLRATRPRSRSRPLRRSQGLQARSATGAGRSGRDRRAGRAPGGVPDRRAPVRRRARGAASYWRWKRFWRPRPRRPASRSPPTASGTSSPRRSSPGEPRSSRCRRSSGTRPRSSPCGPTRTCGRATRTAPGTSWTPRSVRLRTPCGLRRRPVSEHAGQRPAGDVRPSSSPRRSRRSRRSWRAACPPPRRPARPWCRKRRPAWWPRSRDRAAGGTSRSAGA